MGNDSLGFWLFIIFVGVGRIINIVIDYKKKGGG